MAFAYPGDGSPDYAPCRYGGSRLSFRGPARPLRPGYIAVLGGTETYGKFIAEPFPALLEALTGREVVNLGCPNAGPDVFLGEPAFLHIASGARLTVLQLPGAANLSNRLYSVHPRRNDRFLRPSPELRGLYPDLDLTEVHFTHHLLALLRQASARRFETVLAALRTAWIEAMRGLLTRIRAPVVLLWMSDRPPPAAQPADLNGEPLLVTGAMIAAIRDLAEDVVEVAYSRPARHPGIAGKLFAPLDRPAAESVPGPLAHAEVALALSRLLDARG